MIRRPPRSTLFPSTLFRSRGLREGGPAGLRLQPAVPERRRHRHGLLPPARDRKSTRLNSSHMSISYAVFCLKKKKMTKKEHSSQNKRMIKENSSVYNSNRR